MRIPGCVFVALALLAAAQAPAQVRPQITNPGVEAFFNATAYYERGRYREAHRRYLQSAEWGNKLSQFNLGTMYYNGLGVGPDKPRAWAWVKLSAERDYPQLVAAADEIWRELSQAERAQAQRIYENELIPKYGDGFALPRTAAHMQRRFREATGSRMGGSSSTSTTVQSPDSGGNLLTPAEIYYDRDVWKMDRYLEQEEAWFHRMMDTGVPIAEFEEVD